MGHLRWSLPGMAVLMACAVDDGLPAFVQLDTPSVAVMVVTPRVIEFGMAGTGEPRQATFVVANSGGEDLVLDALMIVGSEVFSLTDESSLPLTIGPDDAVELVLSCASWGWGEVADMVVVSNDPKVSEQVVMLYGGRLELPLEP